MPKANPRTLRGTATEKRYNAWLENMPCCLSGRTDSVVRAHTGGWKEGKCLGRKAALWTVLPLHNLLHLEEERGRVVFWESVGFDPVPFAERLYDQFTKNDRAEAELILQEMHLGANLDFVASILRRGAA